MAISQAELITALQTLLSTVKFRLRGRRGTTAQLDPSLMKAGEFAFVTDTHTLYACYVDGVIEQVSHGFIPKATYATLAALQAAHPTGVASDYYMVGTGPYHLYNWGGAAWVDMGTWNDMSLYATAASLADTKTGLVIGEIKMYPFTSAPTKHLLLQGDLVSRTTYAALWALATAAAVTEAAWATDKGKFSVGDGSTTFRLPDFRDQFIRGAGASRGVGTSQLDASQGHIHRIPSPVLIFNGYVGTIVGNSGGIGVAQAADAGAVLNVNAPTADGTNGTPRIASETRPVNVAVNYIIRALA